MRPPKLLDLALGHGPHLGYYAEENGARQPATVADIPSGEVARRLADRGLFVSHGDFYATTAVERLGRSGEGLVRIGCACYTTEGEMERMLDAVREIALRRE